MFFQPKQHSFAFEAEPTALPVAVTPEVHSMLQAGCVVAFSVSGGKDGSAAAIAGKQYLDSIGHTGPRVLVHADLGRVEWKDSLPACERLAQKLGMELLVYRRKAGDMMDRWQGRWNNNVRRYQDLECVKLILPWSTPSMRFCTSELKTKVLESALKRRFPQSEIITVTGVRREESARRRKAPVSKVSNGLTRKGLRGLTWNNVIEWPVEQVFASMADIGLQPHEAYTKYGVSRVSCVFCIMSSDADLAAASTCEDNHGVYVEMVELEALSTFSFQEQKWLADVAPHLLSNDLRERIAAAKLAAAARERAEAMLPDHLLFVDGWPLLVPTVEEADLIIHVREAVASAVGISIPHLTSGELMTKYAGMIAVKQAKAGS